MFKCFKISSLLLIVIGLAPSPILAESLSEKVTRITAEAEAGNVLYQFKLATRYEYGLGVPKDSSKAVRWYQKAANQGHTHAQNNLASMYQAGEGVPIDLVKALELFKKSATNPKSANRSAQYNLGRSYLKGVGVKQSKTQAYQWMSLSVRKKYEYETIPKHQEQELSTLEAQMSKAQLVLAKKHAQICFESNFENCEFDDN